MTFPLRIIVMQIGRYHWFRRVGKCISLCSKSENTIIIPDPGCIHDAAFSHHSEERISRQTLRSVDRSREDSAE